MKPIVSPREQRNKQHSTFVERKLVETNDYSIYEYLFIENKTSTNVWCVVLIKCVDVLCIKTCIVLL